MLDSTARMIATIGIWAAFAVVMTFGVCRMNWSGDNILVTFILTIAMICLAAVAATAFVWRNPRAVAPRTEQRDPAAV